MISAIRAVCSWRADASSPLTAMDTMTPRVGWGSTAMMSSPLSHESPVVSARTSERALGDVLTQRAL